MTIPYIFYIIFYTTVGRNTGVKKNSLNCLKETFFSD